MRRTLLYGVKPFFLLEGRISLMVKGYDKFLKLTTVSGILGLEIPPPCPRADPWRNWSNSDKETTRLRWFLNENPNVSARPFLGDRIPLYSLHFSKNWGWRPPLGGLVAIHCPFRRHHRGKTGRRFPTQHPETEARRTWTERETWVLAWMSRVPEVIVTSW